jgi:hypothetical protein
VANAVSASRDGSLATELRVLDIDDAGTFWTNGQLGDHVLSICQYSSTNGSGGNEATFQDGPDLCADPSRAGTQIEILDGQQNLVSRPTVCAAGFGLASSAAYRGQIRLQFEKDTDDASGMAFTLALNHCLPAGTVLPAVVRPVDILQSTCPEEAVGLQVGASGLDKPQSYPVSAGTWTIQNTSGDRTDTHVSQLALTFSNRDGSVSYSVRGDVSLPQLLF